MFITLPWSLFLSLVKCPNLKKLKEIWVNGSLFILIFFLLPLYSATLAYLLVKLIILVTHFKHFQSIELEFALHI